MRPGDAQRRPVRRPSPVVQSQPPMMGPTARDSDAMVMPAPLTAPIWSGGENLLTRNMHPVKAVTPHAHLTAYATTKPA